MALQRLGPAVQVTRMGAPFLARFVREKWGFLFVCLESALPGRARVHSCRERREKPGASAPEVHYVGRTIGSVKWAGANESQLKELMFCGRGIRLIPVFILGWLTCAHAQYELPDEIFARTLLIRSGNEVATGFKFDHGGRIYLVTPRHIGGKLPLRKANVQVWHGKWIDLATDQVFLPASKDIDLAILKTDERIARPYKVVQSEEVLTTGQKVWYMGWTFPDPRPILPGFAPKSSRPLFPEIPMVKIGTVTAIDPSRPDSFEIHVDGAYNLRIASGPIVYWSPAHRDFEVLGVIERNERDATSAPIKTNPPEEIVKSGILKGYSLDIVVDTIADDPHR